MNIIFCLIENVVKDKDVNVRDINFVADIGSEIWLEHLLYI